MGAENDMQWPSCQDYNEAVQYPDMSFEDEELRQGTVELTPLGLPKVASGNFASVYRFDCGNRHYGVKLFNRNVYGQHQRYALLSQYTNVTNVPHMVDFEYQLKGICIDGNWFPIVKMEWVEGVGLDQFLRKNWSNKAQIDRIIEQFADLVEGLQNANMAHCDLQHGNIMVKHDALKLVDYDGMYVPLMKGQEASELGHTNFQHPSRSSIDFGPHLDNFSAWIIYYSLLCLKLDPSLWQKFEGGDDCLILRKSDFVEPQKSRLLAEIARHPVPEIRACHEPINSLLRCKLNEVPKFVKKGIRASSAATLTNIPSVAALPAPVVPAKWPRADDYFRVLRTPTRALVDDNLSKCLMCATFGFTSVELEIHAAGLTLDTAAIKGRRNVVFRLALIDGSRHYAVKCFLRHEPDRHIRYDAIKKHKLDASKRYFTQFLYQQNGIRVGQDVLPIVKMLWVEGETIDRYASRKAKLGDLDAVDALQSQFRLMLRALTADGIAHGDLEPSNILVDGYGNIKLVDYDAMYVPALAQLQSCEIGQELLQHPNRNLLNYGPYLDNYSAVVIDNILTCMTTNPPERFHNWDVLMQHVKAKAGLKRQSSTMLPQQKKKGPVAMDGPLFHPSVESLRPDPSMVNKFDLEVNRFSSQLQEMNRYRLDLIPPLWNRSHNPK